MNFHEIGEKNTLDILEYFYTLTTLIGFKINLCTRNDPIVPKII